MEPVRAWVHCGLGRWLMRAGNGRTLVLLTEWNCNAPVPAVFLALAQSFRGFCRICRVLQRAVKG
jgi:hypothetical protein